MHKISAKNVILHLQRLTGWNKTKIANDIFGISLSNLGNATREGRLDFYKIYEWAAENGVEIDFNELLEAPRQSNTEGKLSKEKHSPVTPIRAFSESEISQLLSLSREILESETGYADVLDSNIRSLHEAIETKKRLHKVETELSKFRKTIPGPMCCDRRQGERRQNQIEPEIERRSGLERRTGT